MRLLETDNDTICALATAQGIGAISVIRISGIKAVEVVRKLAAFLPENLESHKIYYGILKSVIDASPLDEVLVSYFQQGRSFTGETSFEISCHGSEAVVNEVLNQLVLAGARPAQRGEFTFRAFMSGRVDLVQAESVLALIESRSTRATRLALRQLQGDFSRRLKGLLEDMTWVLAHLEANIDYAAEDIEMASAQQLTSRLTGLKEQTGVLLASYRQGRIVRDGFQMVLVGQPNAGKSSLLNAIAGEERAIVTPVPGTTRDFVEASLTINGLRVTIIDTAGLRITDDLVEKIGVERTLGKMIDADLIGYVIDAEEGISAAERAFFDRVPWAKTLVIANKTDLQPDFTAPADLESLGLLHVSALNHKGLPELKDWLEKRLNQEVAEDSTLVSNARHFQQLGLVRDCLEKAIPLVVKGESPDLIALELQQGMAALYEILGLTYDDQVMDLVFKEFCLGK